MQILKIPSHWTPEQADIIYEFLGDLRAAIWEQYDGEIDPLYDELRKQARNKTSSSEDDSQNN